MAKDDYHVIACYILSYLYMCLRNAETPINSILSLSQYPGDIRESYRDYVYIQLAKEGYIEGIVWGDVSVIGMTKPVRVLKSYKDAQITPKGIAYLENDKSIEKAWDAVVKIGGALFSAISAFR